MDRIGLILALLFIKTSAIASDYGWLNVNRAFTCWSKLGDAKLNTQRPQEFDESGLGIVRTDETDHLITIHSSTGTTVVDKKGNCNYDAKLNADIWASKRIESLVKRIDEFMPKGAGFIRYLKGANGSPDGSEYLSKELLEKNKNNLLEILNECELAKGSIGDTARAALKLFRGPAGTQKSTQSSK